MSTHFPEIIGLVFALAVIVIFVLASSVGNELVVPMLLGGGCAALGARLAFRKGRA